jgi:hypothetical protein
MTLRALKHLGSSLDELDLKIDLAQSHARFALLFRHSVHAVPGLETGDILFLSSL